MVPLEGLQPHRSLYALTPAAGVRASALAFVAALDVTGPASRSSLMAAMATPSSTLPIPQRLAAIREQLSLLADYL